MRRLKAPCFKDGKDCTKRKVGCRKDCEDWQIYEKQQAEYREQLRSTRKVENDADRIAVDRHNQYYRKQKGKYK